jgi:PAS domain S-box-containing protein
MVVGDVLGVMNLWVPPEHEPRVEQEGFLETIGDLLAGIIKRKRTEVRLRQSEERFALAVQGTDAGIWDWDLLTNQVYFSPSWKSILGYEPDEISNDFSEWETRLHPEDRDRAMATVKDYLEGRTTDYELEHRLRHKDGRYRWILARGAAVFDEQGRPYRFVGSHLDITRRREAEERLAKHRAEFLAAQQIQQSLLPQSPPRIPGLDIAGGCYPAQYAAGDGFDFMMLPDGSLLLMIADVVGKGIGPALLMATTGAHLRALASAGLPLAHLVSQTNAMLTQHAESDRFVTLMVCRIDPTTGSILYVNAGHPAGYLIDATGSVKAALDSGQMPVGVLGALQYRESSCPCMSAGDTLVLMTDGVLEARNPEGVLFGTRRLLDLVCAHRDRASAEIVRLVCEEVQRFMGQADFQDDLTMIVIKVQPSSQPA